MTAESLRGRRSGRLLMVTHYFAAHGGGIEIVAKALAVRLAGDSLHVSWVASDVDAHGEPGPNLDFVPMSCWNAVERRIGVPFPLWSVPALWRLGSLVRRADVVLVHDVLYVPNLFAMAFAVLLRRPFILIQHIGLVPFRSAVLRTVMALGNRLLARLAMRQAAAVVFISDTVRRYFADQQGGARETWQLIPNGVDLERFTPPRPAQRDDLRASLGLPADRIVFLFVGRFVEKKGLPLLRRLAEAMPDVQWVFAGWGPLDPTTWALANVRVLQRVPQAALVSWYCAADALVLPSFGEGFPLVVQEAMACGTPAIVATETAQALPDVAEVVLHAPATGAEQDFSAWLDLLKSACEPNVLASRRDATASFVREHWSWDASAALHRKLIDKVLTATGAARR